MDWKAESLALTSFVPTHTSVDALTPFTAIVSGSPSQMGGLEGIPPGQRASIDFGPNRLSVQSRPGRIDVLVEPREGDPPVIERPLEVLRSIAGYADKLIAFGPSSRLAVVANLLSFVASADQAVAKFAELTGIKELPPTATDLVFQTNVPRALSSQLNMNRLVRFGTSQFQLIEFMVTIGAPTGQPPLQTRQWSAVSKAFDFNTAPLPHIFSEGEAKEHFARILDEVTSAMTQEDTQVHAPL